MDTLVNNEQKHTAVLLERNLHWRWFREGDNVPLSPIFTNIQAAVDYPKRNPLLTDEEWRTGQNVVEEPLIIGPNG